MIKFNSIIVYQKLFKKKSIPSERVCFVAISVILCYQKNKLVKGELYEKTSHRHRC